MIHFKKFRNQLFICIDQGRCHFNLNYSILIYFALIYLTLSLSTLIYSVLGLYLSNLSYVDLFKFGGHLITEFTLKLQNYESLCHVLITNTYNYIFESEMKLSPSFVIMHEYYQVSL